VGVVVSLELVIPGRVVPKARPRFDPRSGRAYTEPRYRDWLDMAAQTVAYTLRKPMLDGPLLLRCALSPEGVEVAVMPCSPVEWTGRRPDLDNAIGSVMDALEQGGAVANDRHIVRVEGWFV
jgi:Holliday junction resolvase RusA-like endonuclease